MPGEKVAWEDVTVSHYSGELLWVCYKLFSKWSLLFIIGVDLNLPAESFLLLTDSVFCHSADSKHTLSAGETADGGLWSPQGFDVNVDVKTPLAVDTWKKQDSIFKSCWNESQQNKSTVSTVIPGFQRLLSQFKVKILCMWARGLGGINGLSSPFYLLVN